MNFVKTENKDKQISLCYQIITGRLNVHTLSGRNVAIHVGYTITLHVLHQIKNATRGLSVVVPAVSTSKVFE